MEKATADPVEIPSALPGVEDDDAREKLLFENASNELDDTADDESVEVEEPSARQPKNRWKVLKTLAGFAAFLCFFVIAIAWFFGMGWFSAPKTEAVNRSGQKNAQTSSPATEDEKLKMALNMIAAPSSTSATPVQADSSIAPVESSQIGATDPKTQVDDVSAGFGSGGHQDRNVPVNERVAHASSVEPASLPGKATLSDSQQAVVKESEPLSVSESVAKDNDSDDARGRSLFFGISKKSDKETEVSKPVNPAKIIEAISPEVNRPAQIPFGTMLPVRVIGSIYTLRNSGGFVRMELTRPVEGKGYLYPAGTMIVGNVRGGGSNRAFVDIVGLVEPVSGELVRFSGELLGRDGASGIEGKRRNLTSQWARFFRGMKDTAGSVLGSIGSLRSGGTVILSEPMRRGSQSMTEDLSGALLKNGREDTFLEVAAGSNGYVLVTVLPENSAAPAHKRTTGALKE